jgi:hypothetical protein
VSVDWDEKFPNSHLRGLGSDASDHYPLLLHTNMGRMAKARFHFEIYWPKFNDFKDVVARAWHRPEIEREPLACLDVMLRVLVRALQSWAATRIGEIKAQLLMACELILQLDIAQDERGLTEEEAGLRKRMKMRCLGLSSL